MAPQPPEAAAGAESGSEPGAGPGPEPGPVPGVEPAPAPRAEQEHAPGPEPGPGHGGPPAGRWLWATHSAELARVTAIDLALLAGHVLLYPTGILPEHGPTPAAPTGHRDARGAPSPEAHPPVLLLHGFVDNRSALTLLRRSLLRHGWTRVRAANYSPLTFDIRAAAELLGPLIEQICAQSGQPQVDIVGHSLGGLVARYYVQCLGGDARVRTLVTLGTPHAGTRAVPALAPHPLARQMRPGSPVLEELAGPAKGCRTRFVAFWSDLDQVMIPVESACLEHPDLRAKNVRVSGIGHLALPVHTAVAAEIRRALTENESPQDAIDAA